MDPSHFDRFVRSLGRPLARRSLLAALGGLLPVFPRGRDAAAADCNNSTRQCVPSLKCCGGACKRPSPTLKCQPCPGCDNGRACVKINRRSRRGFCQGVAGGRCVPKAGCIGGAVCVPSGPDQHSCACPGGLSACDGRCVNLHTDPQHCGSCLNQCLLGVTTCCAVGVLDPGECVDTQTDERHCGGCGRPCGTGEICLGGRCQSQCRAGQTLCDGTCVDLGSDFLNCGQCGRSCRGEERCQNGTCVANPSCVPYAGVCSNAAECCSGVPCNGGLCRYP
jgi:hypothetical protein